MSDNPQVKVTVTADTGPYRRSMSQAAAETSKVEKASTSVTAGLTKQAAAWATAAGAGMIAGQKITSVIQDSIQAASDLTESTSKMQVVFGSASSEIRAFAEDSTRSFGLSKRAAYDATATFGIFGQAAGLSGKELAAWSEQLAQRAVDMSSMFGGTVDEAITAVGAALRGESEPIRRYGVLLDDATLKSRALEEGLISSTTQGLTPQTRALAAAKELLQQSNIAAGDYTRTIDGLANSQREAAKQWEDAKAQFGQAAQPLATKGTQASAGALSWISESGLNSIPVFGAWLNVFMGKADDAADSAQNLGRWSGTAANLLAQMGRTSQSAVGGVHDLAGAMDRAASSTQGATTSLSDYIDAQQAVASARRGLASMEDDVRAGMANTVTSTGGATKASEARTKAVQREIDALRKADAAQEKSEIEAARRAAQRKADARADAGARRDVRKGVAEAIATDKAAKRGEDIDGFNQGSSVGEASGSLTDSEQKALDKKIDGIRARHQKALDAQIKGLREANKAARDTGASTTYYSTSLDENTEAGRRNLDVLDSKVDAVQANADALKAAATLDGKSAAEAQAIYDQALLDGYDAIMDTYEGLGFARSEVKAYLKYLGLVPKLITTTLKVDIDTAALDKAAKKYGPGKGKVWNPTLGAWLPGGGSAQQQADASKNAEISRPTVGSTVSRVPKKSYPSNPKTQFATGGEVGGPAGVDNVPIWASRGEYIVAAPQYAANRDLVQAINAGTGRVNTGTRIDVGGVVVHGASNPMAATVSVIDGLAEAAYRQGVVR